MDSGITHWRQDGVSTLPPGLQAPGEEMSAPAAGTVAGVVLVVLIIIALLLTFGVLLDCRHKKALQKKLQVVRRRAGAVSSADVESDTAGSMQHLQPAAVSLVSNHPVQHVQPTTLQGRCVQGKYSESSHSQLGDVATAQAACTSVRLSTVTEQ